VEVDPDVRGFFEDCAALGLPVSVVSDGYDWAVRRILARVGAPSVPVVANRLVHVGEDRFTVLFPHGAPQCGSGVCKCAATGVKARRVHIGDGRSDTCVADKADLVFAKSHLLESRRARGVASVPFERFSEIRAYLPDLEGLVGLKSPGPLQRSA
jgi:2-hydroxy-3-keto-5-methylthiopentenyl-1-phosphate phosphatase